MSWEDIATFSTAALGAITTVGAWPPARRSATTAETLTRIERDRCHEERWPAADQRALGDADSPARVLAWRIPGRTATPSPNTRTGLASTPHTSYETTPQPSPLPLVADVQRRR